MEQKFSYYDFLSDECELQLKQPLTTPHGKIFVAYDISNHKLVIETG